MNILDQNSIWHMIKMRDNAYLVLSPRVAECPPPSSDFFGAVQQLSEQYPLDLFSDEYLINRL